MRHLRREAGRLRDSFAQLATARDRLVREEKLAAVGRLAGAVAHEVRNPVAMIVSALGLARDETLDPSGQRKWLEVAGDEARRLETLTQDFLSYARQKEPDRQPTSLATAVGYVASLARAREAASGVSALGPVPRGRDRPHRRLPDSRRAPQPPRQRLRRDAAGR